MLLFQIVIERMVVRQDYPTWQLDSWGRTTNLVEVIGRCHLLCNV